MSACKGEQRLSKPCFVLPPFSIAWYCVLHRTYARNRGDDGAIAVALPACAEGLLTQPQSSVIMICS